jgi:hypothetical protein
VYYILDTNIWVDVNRGKVACDDLRKPGLEVALAPLMVVELMMGVVRGGEALFPLNRTLFECMARVTSSILELPKVFVLGVLWGLYMGDSGVQPHHYQTLIELVLQSKTHRDFLNSTERPESAWKKISELSSIHNQVLDKELGSLKAIAERASIKNLHMHMVRMYRLGGLLPDPDLFEETFSAAVEFVRSSVALVRNGANPLKNNRGMYIDSQFFWYLGDPNAVVVTKEDFSREIRASPQRSRILSLDAFLRL